MLQPIFIDLQTVQPIQVNISMWQGGPSSGGSVKIPITVSSNYSIALPYNLIRANGTITITLPVSTGSGYVYDVINIGTSTVTVVTQGTDTIDGVGSSIQIISQFTDVTFCDAVLGHWEII